MNIKRGSAYVPVIAAKAPGQISVSHETGLFGDNSGAVTKPDGGGAQRSGKLCGSG